MKAPESSLEQVPQDQRRNDGYAKAQMQAGITEERQASGFGDEVTLRIDPGVLL
jgi:hypothetical protein